MNFGSGTFTPGSRGAELANWYKADAGVYSDAAASFDSGASEALTSASTAALSMGDVDFWISTWFLLSVGGSDRVILAKTSLATLEYFLRYQFSSNRIQCGMYNGTTATTLNANTYGGPATGVWTHVFMYYDSVNDTINISVNNGATDSVAHTGGAAAAGIGFAIGKEGERNTDYWHGRIDNTCMGKSPPGGIAALASTINTYLYNGGAGRSYEDLSTTQKTDWGMGTTMPFWPFSEKTGTRYDVNGTNDLADINTVGVDDGIVNGLAGDNDAVTTWFDQTGAAWDMSPAAIAEAPTYRTNIENGLPVVRFDGVDDTITTAIFTPIAQPQTTYIVLSPDMSDPNRVFMDSNDGTTRRYLSFRSGTNDMEMFAGGSILSSAVATTGFHVVTAVWNGASGAIYFDNVLVGSGNIGTDAMDSLRLGRRFVPSGTTYYTGDIGEVVVTNVADDAAQRLQMYTYLQNRWGI